LQNRPAIFCDDGRRLTRTKRICADATSSLVRTQTSFIGVNWQEQNIYLYFTTAV
jgi:hypothetical protein